MQGLKSILNVLGLGGAADDGSPRYEAFKPRRAAPYRVPAPELPCSPGGKVGSQDAGSVREQLRSGRTLLTPREAAQVETACNMLRERLMNSHECRPRPQDFERYLHLLIADQPRERFVVLFLGAGDELIGEDVMFSGDKAQVPVFIPEVIRAAFERRANGVVVAHNHPSGPAMPSEADTQCLAAIRTALAAVGIRYVDDIIVARHETYSHRRAGTL